MCRVFGPRQGNRHEDISDDHNRLSQHEFQIVTQHKIDNFIRFEETTTNGGDWHQLIESIYLIE